MAKPSRTSKQSQSKQTGGTFLGIVLGLIVGLAIAVIVALYITRAPTPFVAKVAPPAESSSAPAAQPYDPNRPLQGKSPGQAVPQAAQPTPPNTAPGQSTNQTQSSGVLDEPQIVEVPPSGGTASAPRTASPTIAKKPEAAPGSTGSPGSTSSTTAATPPKTGSAPPATAKTTPPAPGDVNTGYFLQVGAYKTQADAEQQRARLGFQGFESKVTQRDAGGVTYYRVRIGPFAKFEDMNTARQRLSDAGVDTAVIRFSKQ
ncbi:SPOR domain-containing protein [Caballeronia sp. AZ10_KS36]|uniref:SPOR domain-containing protein n=1 Tax=Caballeronia sp. AZ10_KS36 TaxID=2921757 RepID=UPI0020286D94|nr:SPOR domain-containing protein [Caballeronia sp. AZ10_KS36]